MDLTNISIFQILEKIPSLLKFKLLGLNINNVQQVLDLDLLSFSKQPSVGRKATTQLFELQKWVKNEMCNEHKRIEQVSQHQILVGIADKIVYFDFSENLAVIEFKVIKKLIPSKLYNKFEINNICNIQDLQNLTYEEFKRFKSVGKQTTDYLKEFVKNLKDNPEIFIKEYSCRP